MLNLAYDLIKLGIHYLGILGIPYLAVTSVVRELLLRNAARATFAVQTRAMYVCAIHCVCANIDAGGRAIFISGDSINGCRWRCLRGNVGRITVCTR